MQCSSNIHDRRQRRGSPTSDRRRRTSTLALVRPAAPVSSTTRLTTNQSAKTSMQPTGEQTANANVETLFKSPRLFIGPLIGCYTDDMSVCRLKFSKQTKR